MVGDKELREIANVLRRDVLMMTTAAGSGHATSCLSCAEIMSALFFKEMKYDVHDAYNVDNDEFILSKGHAAPILYACLKHAGCIRDDLPSLRRFESVLEGHPIVGKIPWIKVATGSLGQGASVGVGMALAGKLQGRKYRVYVLMGDSESSEGSVYEALQLGARYALDNLWVIVDVNRLGQVGETMLGHNVEKYKKRFESFGWQSEVIDGHDTGQIMRALRKVGGVGKPTAIIAKTWKGKGVFFLENQEGWHGRALSGQELRKALEEIPEHNLQKIKVEKPTRSPVRMRRALPVRFKHYAIGSEVATREAYGESVAELCRTHPHVVVLDGEVSNSTFSDRVKKSTPKQFIECYIAEQNMIGMTLGLSKKGFRVFASTFGAFLTRAGDQLRMSALSKGNFVVSGSHGGVSVGADGASQMGLEDIALFRALPQSVVLYPSDAVSTTKLVELAAAHMESIVYIRTTRPATPVIYKDNEDFSVGEFKIIWQSKKDRVVLVGAGITLHEALEAYSILRQEGILCAVVDLYCVKPFHGVRFLEFVRNHGKKIVVAEDHYSAGGIGEMIAGIVAGQDIMIERLSIQEIPHSGKTEELLKHYGINREAIVKRVRKLIGV